MNIHSSPSRPTILPRFGVKKTGSTGPDDGTGIDYSKLDAYLSVKIKQGKFPIPLLFQSKAPLTEPQVQELKSLGLTARSLAGNIGTGQLENGEHLAKLTHLDYLVFLQAARQMRPNS